MSTISSSTDGQYQYYRKRLGELEDEVATERQRTREDYQRRANDLEKSYNSSLDDTVRESERAVDRDRDHNAAIVERERRTGQNEVEDTKRQIYDRYGKLAQETAARRRDDDENVKQVAQQFRDELSKSEQNAAEARTEQDRTHAAREERDAANLEFSRERETNELRNKVETMLQREIARDKEKGKAIVEARRDVENEATNRERYLQQNFASETARSKRHAESERESLMDRHDKVVHDQGQHFSNVIAEREQDQAKKVNELARNYDNSLAEDQRSYAHRSRNLDDALDQRVKDNSEELETAMRRQAQTYQGELDRQAAARKQDAADLRREQDEHRKDLADTTRVHPAVEEKLRMDFAAHNVKLLAADISRNHAQTERIQENYNDELEKLRELREGELTHSTRLHNSERQLDRNVYLNHVQEMAKNHQMDQAEEQAASRHQLDGARRGYMHVLEAQKREADRLLQDSREDGNARITAARQEADLQLKTTHQELVAQNNATVREYEKKLMDQKTEHEQEMDDFKNEVARNKNESERRTRQLLDDQTRAYDQKIAQMEFQSKERERMITENYQDQMDRMKRAHALQQQQLQKKS